MENDYFARNLVKGKIAETIFAQMFREVGEFTVIEFGYEKIIPELVQQKGKNRLIIETLRTAPDFAVIDLKFKKVKLIEVKYKHISNPKYILEDAVRMSRSWNPSYLFVATLTGFYFDSINTIIKNKGEISQLKHSQITGKVQARYLKILQDFENKK
ncbi:MAG: hypothetical protein KAU07_00830 [Candidatus Andersenbacteria bacterium]|nr:hypothetical protein [Candidatus Andersenbacteria bacterium]